jgi:exosortase
MPADLLRRSPGLVIATHALACWPVWRWYLARATDGSDEPWGIAALLAALALTWPHDRRLRLQPDDRLLLAAAALMFLYAVLTPFAPPLVRAIVAMASLGCSWVSIADARRKWPIVVVLFVLSVPIIASLQFYAGYPLRALTSTGASALLNVFGIGVAHVGTTMTWNGQTVLVDAPCSGVRMLWAGAFLACLLVAQRRSITWPGLTVALLLVLPVTLLANAIRAALLFVLEVQSEPPSEFLHASVGVVTFALAGLAIVGLEALLRRGDAARARSRAYSTLSVR